GGAGGGGGRGGGEGGGGEVGGARWGREVAGGRRPLFGVADVAQIERLAEPAPRFADQQNVLVRGLEGDARRFGKVVEHADAADRGCRQDRAAVGLVVERDVAGHDRKLERRAGLRDAADAADQLAHDLTPLRLAQLT